MDDLPIKLIISKSPKPVASAVNVQPSLQEIHSRPIIYYDIEVQQKNEKGFKQPQICRICQIEETQEDKLIIPCRCIELSKYVHEDCLISKLLKRVESQYMEGNPVNTVRCESCGQVLKCKIQYNHKLSYTAFLKNIQKKSCQCILVLILFGLIALSISLPSIIASFTNKTNFLLYIPSEPCRVGLLVAFCLIFIFELALLIVFVRQNVAYLQIVIEKVFNFYDRMENFTLGKEFYLDDNQMIPLQYFTVTKG